MPDPGRAATPRVVWIVSDGKPGHLNQSLGLAEALARATPTTIHTLPALPAWRALLALLLKRVPGPALPAPDLILGAGHATHLTLLAARRARGGRTVVLMKPSLPRRCFDLCMVPRHDGLAGDAHTLVTEGALNRIRPAATHDSSLGLILVGGVSRHFDWDSDAIQLQIKSILARTPDTQWTLTTSRRTPADFLEALPTFPNLSVTPHTATSPEWLPTQLARCGTAWVTPDSASMVYEALTAGAEVGVFDLPVNPKSRVGWAISELADAQRITRFVSWCAHGVLHPDVHPLAEADRCAGWILEWLENT
ncbi:MAG: mitochondrial fission ELM1 family protein [Thiobacillus sp.]|uniref:mitochondrial fission ELM1 family protein n=1 Tax=Thiobacillus sp. TaxID=924 RepID=UPI00273273A2|nr:mitochondrial fission ELM1 family protein [Thiobacillus sp.]MDP3584893.1 mitochondrial fission ELM1 family protein [Thiobacillus sp.]